MLCHPQVTSSPGFQLIQLLKLSINSLRSDSGQPPQPPPWVWASVPPPTPCLVVYSSANHGEFGCILFRGPSIRTDVRIIYIPSHVTLPVFSWSRTIASIQDLPFFLPSWLSPGAPLPRAPFQLLLSRKKKGWETREREILWIIQGGSVGRESALFVCTLIWTDILAASSQGRTKERVWRAKGRRGRRNTDNTTNKNKKERKQWRD